MGVMKIVSPVALFALLAATPALAAPPELDFDGEGKACFGAGCDSYSDSDAIWGGAGWLTFDGGAFSGSTIGGGSTFQYGRLFADAVYADFNSPISIFLDFAAPTGLDPDPIFGGNVSGGIFFGLFTNGRLTFQNPTQTFAFTGPGAPGSFTVTMHDINLNPIDGELNGTVYLTGSITDATVTPEPVSMALLGTGLAGLAAVRRRRQGSADVENEE